jgi:hypothetical protein
MYPSDFTGQGIILLRSAAGAALAPGIEAGTGDTVHSAHQRDGVVFPVCFDELEDFRF